MGGNTNLFRGRLTETAHSRRANSLRVKQGRSRVVMVAVPLALLLAMFATKTQAVSPRQKARSASSVGLQVMPVQRRLMVVQATAPYGDVGLRSGDQIVAVNSRRVSTEAALMNRLSSSGRQGTSITIARNGSLYFLNAPPFVNPAPAPSGEGAFVNLSFMVMTSQGAMHRDAAARLGLSGTPISGSPEGP